MWGAWLAGLMWMAAVWGWQVPHPHFLPPVVLLAIQVVGGLEVLEAAFFSDGHRPTPGRGTHVHLSWNNAPLALGRPFQLRLLDQRSA